MQRIRQTLTALALPLLAGLVGCDAEEKCTPLAEHIVEVVQKAQGEVAEEAKQKALKETLDSCKQSTPEQAVIDCSMAAETVEALKACDKKASE